MLLENKIQQFFSYIPFSSMLSLYVCDFIDIKQ